MQTNKITKRAALLAIIGGMAALPLSTMAASKSVAAGQNIVESGTAYDDASGHALRVDGGTYSGTHITLSATLASRIGAYAINSGSLFLHSSTITTRGSGGAAVLAGASGTDGYASLKNSTIETYGDNSHGVLAQFSGEVLLENVTITTSGSNSHGVQGASGSVKGVNVQVVVNHAGSGAIRVATGGSVDLTGGSLSSAGDLIVVAGANNIHNEVTLNGVQTANAGNVLAATGSANITVNATDTDLTGKVSGTDAAVIDLNLKNSTVTGEVTGSGSSTINVGLSDSTVTGNITANNDSKITITGSNGSTIIGDVTGSGSSGIVVNLDDSTLTGNTTANDDSQIIINGGNGSTITGDVTGSGSSVIDITVTGPGGSFIGDINKNDDAAVVITIDDGATGKGGFNGGDLNVLGPDSVWDFDKDSHVNNGWNDGTLNIGDKTVIFDNLTNNGKILINVDTDSGGHGTLDVTGSTGGDGKINVNVTGSTALTDDEKNKVINDLLDNNAKGAWEFDPIDWGLEELIPTPGPDGNFYLRPDGKLSAAGSIAVGLLAAQKGSWFAQQNSLLKRMGELRLQNNTESVNIIGKDDKSVTLSADKLIENVWIRAYGQQLNYGASVTGQAFRQYVYGVDIGTDHKWTLDADNDLYTGVFAGYGAADTDHRHHGSKSEIHNYYFGLYASWLNVDGWYLDATVKAQYADNDLSGSSNSGNYFGASYNNWAVGGSVEIGKQFKFEHDWFIEPQLQANYLHLLAEDYTMSGNALSITVSDLDAFQLRAGVVFGRTLKLKNGGALQPYVKVSGVELISSGGKLSAAGNNVRPNLDGARAEIGAGIIWQLDAHSQLHLDYEASFGDKYDKPWGLNLGYCYQF